MKTPEENFESRKHAHKIGGYNPVRGLAENVNYARRRKPKLSKPERFSR